MQFSQITRDLYHALKKERELTVSQKGNCLNSNRPFTGCFYHTGGSANLGKGGGGGLCKGLGGDVPLGHETLTFNQTMFNCIVQPYSKLDTKNPYLVTRFTKCQSVLVTKLLRHFPKKLNSHLKTDSSKQMENWNTFLILPPSPLSKLLLVTLNVITKSITTLIRGEGVNVY